MWIRDITRLGTVKPVPIFQTTAPSTRRRADGVDSAAQHHVYRQAERTSPVTHSRDREFRLIRPLVFVTEEITAAYAESLGAPLVPCGCSQRTGTVRRSLREIFHELEQDYPHLKENILSAMGNVDTQRLLDTRYLSVEGGEERVAEVFPIVGEG